MRIVFMGSDEVACPALEQLAACDEVDIVAVVTQPDRPSGRRRHLTPCAAKALALQLDLPVLDPEKIGQADAVAQLQELAPEVLVVVAYGQYIPERVRTIPPRGAINLHPSLLPRFRGASPIQQTLAHGDAQGGVTILYVSKEMDAGDILLQETVDILPNENAVELGPRLAQIGAGLLVQALGQIERGTVSSRHQIEADATYVGKLCKEDGLLNWSQPALLLNNQIRGYQPWPVCYTTMPDDPAAPLRIYRAVVVEGSGQPGEVLSIKGEGPVVAAGEQALRLLDVQPPGKKRMSGQALACGRYLEVGNLLGTAERE